MVRAGNHPGPESDADCRCRGGNIPKTQPTNATHPSPQTFLLRLLRLETSSVVYASYGLYNSMFRYDKTWVSDDNPPRHPPPAGHLRQFISSSLPQTPKSIAWQSIDHEGLQVQEGDVKTRKLEPSSEERQRKLGRGGGGGGSGCKNSEKMKMKKTPGKRGEAGSCEEEEVMGSYLVSLVMGQVTYHTNTRSATF